MAELSTIARPYAVAAYKLGREQKALTKWSDMLSFAVDVAMHPAMKTYIEDPKILDTDLQATFLKACGDQLNEFGQNLIKVLIENKRITLLPAIKSAFEALKAKDEGVLETQIVAAAALSTAETQDLVARLETKFGKKIEANVTVDPALIGGFKIIVGDTVIDASVKAQLQNLGYLLSA